MKRPKLSIDEQIADMQSKGITFEYSDINDAKYFLKHNNYYFKLKVYEKNHFVNGARYRTCTQSATFIGS